MKDIPWTDNRGESGVIKRMDAFQHTQEYYPGWLDDNLTFSGTRLPQNAWYFEQGKYKKQWVLLFMRYGYADNLPNSDEEGCSIDISWAVDENRQPKNLDFIDFIRIYNGMNQTVPQLGETSTEVAGAHDLHLEASLDAIRTATAIVSPVQSAQQSALYNLQGQRVSRAYRGICIKNGNKFVNK